MSHARRRELSAWFTYTLARLEVGPHVIAELKKRRPQLLQARSIVLISFGKAAHQMATAALTALDGLVVRGLCVPPELFAAPLPPLEVIAGGHPLPTLGSQRAAVRALELCRTADPRDVILCLVSGGGSAILELPADPNVSIDELRTFQQALVGCGAPITQINTIRKHLSAVKGGHLAAAAAHCAQIITLMISDVPDDQLSMIASGPTAPESSTLADCRALLIQYGLVASLPPALRQRLEAGNLPPPIGAAHPVFTRSEPVVLLGNKNARHWLRMAATARGIHVIDDAIDDQPFVHTADHLLARLRQLKRNNKRGPVALLNGGEVTVSLPATQGLGGRNQQFALLCALRIDGEPITILSAGTDGIDGNSPAAGAVADGDTVARAKACGLDARQQLRQFDSFPLFRALEDAIVTGPSGTNVRDLRLLIHE
ncbi:MAG: DUF4147 domain-containing protein [Planctomycetota bacterium]|nr:DUF4147 domain-containing protein [Planctomycetota bacterium]